MSQDGGRCKISMLNMSTTKTDSKELSYSTFWWVLSFKTIKKYIAISLLRTKMWQTRYLSDSLLAPIPVNVNVKHICYKVQSYNVMWIPLVHFKRRNVDISATHFIASGLTGKPIITPKCCPLTLLTIVGLSRKIRCYTVYFLLLCAKFISAHKHGKIYGVPNTFHD